MEAIEKLFTDNMRTLSCVHAFVSCTRHRAYSAQPDTRRRCSVLYLLQDRLTDSRV
jgi:hypothetical protein